MLRKLLDRLLFARLWMLAFLLDRSEPARFCPLCGAGSDLSRWAWWRIERRDEEIICANCCGAPRLWVKARTQ